MVSFRPTVAAVVAAVTIAAASNTAVGQSVVLRSPNLSGGWIGDPGTLQFNFVHRFSVSDPPTRKVSNSPTFVLGYRIAGPVLLGMTYATSSDVAPRFPNEWELFGRSRLLSRGGFDVATQVGYNQAAGSMDAEFTWGLRSGPVRFIAVQRVFTDGYDSGESRSAFGGGMTLRLRDNVALAGDLVTLYHRRPGEEIAWGAALQLAIPYSPHTFSLQVTNTNTGTLQGASRGLGNVRGGFEFTIPFTLNRYFGRKAAGGGGGAVAPGGPNFVMARLEFAPKSIEVTAGTTVVWTNRDQLVHTITADDGSWDSGEIRPGTTWSRTFDTPGTYAFHCTPHPFMTGVVVVK